jgi:hypothetical protein
LYAGISASTKSTSVRGSISSRSCRPPASNTSSTIRRSSSPSDSCAETRSRSSSSDITSRFAFGSPPRARTTRSVDLDSSQMTGRAPEAILSTSGARPSANVSARCSASRLAASSPITIET